MFTFLTKADAYGQGFNFHIPENGDHRTALGGLITILYWVGTLACTLYFGKDIVLKENPAFLKENIVLDESPYLDLNRSITNFTIYFRIIDTANRNNFY